MTTRIRFSGRRASAMVCGVGIVLLVTHAPHVVCAQTCTGDVTLSTQAQVSEFNCSQVTGDLTISGTDIEHLDGLSSLTSVGGTVGIANNPVLSDLGGLASLASIGGSLLIQNNETLAQLDGLSSLASVGGSVLVLRNAALVNVHGLSSVTSIGSTLRIWSNFALTNVDGLSSLTSVFSLDITLNFQLTRCCGLFPVLSGNGVADTITLSDNGGACSSVQDVLDGGPCITAVQRTTWGDVKRRYR